MKALNVFLYSLLFVSLTSCNGESEAAIGEYTTIEVDPVYDGGTVAKGEIVRAEIKVKNTGDYPLVLAEVKGACSCTVSDFSQDPVAPGETTIIEAEVDTDKTGKGLINKSVTIMANTRPARTQVTVQAKVID
jgi:hypothetical protein